MLGLLARLKPRGQTDIAQSIHQLAAMIRHRSLVILFSDLLADPEPILNALHHLSYAGHDIIIFHVLDEAEARFPFDGIIEFEEPEQSDRLTVDAAGIRRDYLDALAELMSTYRAECSKTGIDYVQIDTSMPFDKALTEYLANRKARF